MSGSLEKKRSDILISDWQLYRYMKYFSGISMLYSFGIQVGNKLGSISIRNRPDESMGLGRLGDANW